MKSNDNMIAIEEEMKRSYLDYAMSVIVSRALPDVRDGLKPVHRRILYAMKEAGNEYNRPYRKSANVVGNVMGKYHPHGDMPIYDAMVRLTQNFNLRLTLIDGQGNFGSIDGDAAAAARYTEARLSKAAHDLLADIDLDTVDFQPNYDETTHEPKVLPARFPNLLVNGVSGIAVGMATNIPTHNLGEIIDGCLVLLSNTDVDVVELMQSIPGPDFPTGGIILGRAGILEAYKTGRGGIMMRGVSHMEKIRERDAIIIDEIPYQVNKAKMIERIAELVKEKTIEGISDLRDESDRDGMRVVIELKRDAVYDVVLNQLYRHTSLQCSFNFNMLALSHGRPCQMSLKEILQAFLDFREEVIIRRNKFELSKARIKAHKLMGFAVAVSNLDLIINLIKTSKDKQLAKDRLMECSWDASSMQSWVELVGDEMPLDGQYRFSETQAVSILELRLHRLTGMERDKIHLDLKETVDYIQERLSVLGSRERVLEIMKQELLDIKNQLSTPRRTSIEEGDASIEIEDLIQKEDMVVTVSMNGYIKRVPLDTYRAQKRGGRGRSGMETREEDIVKDVFVANTHDNVLFFSTKGRVYRMKVYKLPLATPQSKGRALVNLLPLEEGETIATVLVLPHDLNLEQNFLMFGTSFGHVRRNRISDFSYIPSNGKRAMKLDAGEELVGVMLCTEEDDVLFAAKSGTCNRFNVKDIRVFSGRDSNGVRGMKMTDSDKVISMAILSQGKITIEERELYVKMTRQSEDGAKDEINLLPQERFEDLEKKEQFILSITENGYGKRSSAYEYRTTNRGTMGYRNIITSDRNGSLVASFPVENEGEIILVTDQGRLIRCPVKDIRITGRSAQGVIIFRVDKNEKVVAASYVEREDKIEDLDLDNEAAAQEESN
jgi:DNA gyrase subunit A